MADLIFNRPPYTGGPVHLVFGASPPVVLPDPVTVTGTSALGGISGNGVALYDNRNPRRASTAASLPHQVAAPNNTATGTGWGQSQRHLGGTATGWQPAAPTARQTAAAWVVSARAARSSVAAWGQGAPAQALAMAAHQAARSVVQQKGTAWDAAAAAQARAHQAALVHQAARSLINQAAQLWQKAAQQSRQATARHGTGQARALRLLAIWETGRPVPPGREVWPKPVAPVLPRVPSTHLVFACPPWAGGAVHLVFGRVCAGPFGPPAQFAIYPARFYMAVHTLTAHTLPGMQPVPIFGVSLSADAGSFAWTFSASGPVSLFDQLAPAAGLPAQIQITLDGIPFVFLVDSIKRQDAFGKRGAQISGRSATALLARPYAREAARLSTADATAQQLALQALEFTGAALDWGLTDWLVPAGAWSHTGTPLAAVQAIAEAAGGYIQSHRTAATLLARHPYPELPGGIPGGPWGWSGAFAADVDLAPDAIITSGIERRDGPDINAVWVSGTTQGVLARIKRTGTAADKLASLITDPLITATEAAQQRGLSVLGAAGPKHLVQIDLPILTGAGQPGVLDVGQLVQINEASPWRGRVRSVSVNATMPQARQTIQLERHLEIA